MAPFFAWMTLLIGLMGMRGVAAHGKLTQPASRNELGGTSNCAHCLNGGGPCGDTSSLNFYAGPQATWTAGSIVPIEVLITAHHRGHYEFRICDQVLNSRVANPDACLNKWVLERATPEEAGFRDCRPGDQRAACVPFDPLHPERWYLPPSGEVNLRHTIYFKVPAGLQCEACTLQWHWWSANSCIPAGDYGCYKDILQSNGYWVNSKSPWWTVGAGSCSGPAGPNGHSGCGEQFWNCADIKVLGNGGPITTRRTTQAPATTTTAAVTTVAPPSATTTMPSSSACTVVNGAAEYGATSARCNAVCQLLPAGQWPCGPGHACDCTSMGTTTAVASSTPQVSSTMTETMPATTTATTPTVPTGGTGSARCFKTPGLGSNGATDANCAACTTKTIWPCNGQDWTVNPPQPLCTCTGSLAEVSSHSVPGKKAGRQAFLGTSLLQDGAVTTHAGASVDELGEEL